MLALFSLNLTAEQKFYIWVDERGITHSTPLKTTKEPEPAIENADSYLTEAEVEHKLQQDKADHQPFYTWTDGQGQLRSQLIPEAEEEAGALDELAVSDYTLLRATRYVHAAAVPCCTQFQLRFQSHLSSARSLVLRDPALQRNFPREQGLASAWYVNLPAPQDYSADSYPLLSIKVRHTDQPLALIALDKHYQVLHYLAQMRSQYVGETWRSIAYYETLISQADTEVAALIVYFPEAVNEATTVELKWLY